MVDEEGNKNLINISNPHRIHKYFVYEPLTLTF